MNKFHRSKSFVEQQSPRTVPAWILCLAVLGIVPASAQADFCRDLLSVGIRDTTSIYSRRQMYDMVSTAACDQSSGSFGATFGSVGIQAGESRASCSKRFEEHLFDDAFAQEVSRVSPTLQPVLMLCAKNERNSGQAQVRIEPIPRADQVNVIARLDPPDGQSVVVGHVAGVRSTVASYDIAKHCVNVPKAQADLRNQDLSMVCDMPTDKPVTLLWVVNPGGTPTATIYPTDPPLATLTVSGSEDLNERVDADPNDPSHCNVNVVSPETKVLNIDVRNPYPGLNKIKVECVDCGIYTKTYELDIRTSLKQRLSPDLSRFTSTWTKRSR